MQKFSSSPVVSLTRSHYHCPGFFFPDWLGIPFFLFSYFRGDFRWGVVYLFSCFSALGETSDGAPCTFFLVFLLLGILLMGRRVPFFLFFYFGGYFRWGAVYLFSCFSAFGDTSDGASCTFFLVFLLSGILPACQGIPQSRK